LSLIDLAIPAIAGLLLFFFPQLFVKCDDLEKINSFRTWGVGLMVIAAIYLLIKAVSSH